MKQWTERPLEFNQIRQMVEELATSTLGKEWISQMQPSTERQTVQLWLDKTEEAMVWLRMKGEISLRGLVDIRPSLKRAELGGILNEEECLGVAGTIRAGRNAKSSLRQVDIEKYELPLLRQMTEAIESLENLEHTLTDSIDEQEIVRDSASPELSRIRRQMETTRAQIQSNLQQVLRNKQKMLQEAIITQRFDRYVIPVKSEYRVQFGGIVHDQSASGATLFMEPQSVVPLNNQLRELELKETREVERILAELTNLIAEQADFLRSNIDLLGEIDFLLAKARFAHRHKAVIPNLATQRTISLRKARHPLLDPKIAVPIDVELSTPIQALLITGPNTGGKTVSLKTVGLAALMAQCGLPILAEPESTISLFSGIFADIGDEQSIEQSLSTFSGHMTNIIRILSQMDSDSLILFDELGAGTDPTEGAALAISILEDVMERGATVMATTHYSELKVFAHTHPHALNASVEFDVETLRPTYRLLIGVPGKSNAFAISRRLGLSLELIDAAEKHLSPEERDLEEMIATLTAERKAAEETLKEAMKLREEAESMHAEVRTNWERFEEEKIQLREKARQEARRIVNRAEQEADEVLKELREWAKLRPQDLKEHELNEMRARLGKVVPEMKLPQKMVSKKKEEKLEVGDEVYIPSFQQKGFIVEEVGNKEFQVQIGVLKMKLKANQLEKRETPKQQTKQPKATFVRSNQDVSPELDLRGKMVEEAIQEIDQYLDHSVLAGYKQIHLIHGKGTGALRTGVQNFLRRHRSVKSYRLGAIGEGGSGVTVVELK
ncbi:endonuclease MutS2 [Risungbinella massiliensis]|uniref:endonuclease MutS2 n=1 Tax=Risungbinella massiliensis TaxID=1329796 RepID=UPI00069B4492|nr:endonuclease MutS2 [Risungbinella massiliensis]